MCLAGFAACGGSDPSAADHGFPATYAGDIKNDCQQYVACQQEKEMQAPANFVDKCIEAESKALNDNPTQQPLFLTRITRCQGRVSCDWETCTTNTPTPEYGMTQIDKLNYLCAAETQCKVDMGMQVGDPQAANANCAGIYVGTLDNLSVAERSQFQTAFDGCSTMTSCQFLGCMGMMGVNVQQ
jgi:hypothetical protein